MAHVIIAPGWQGREGDVTPEHIYLSRRRVLRRMGFSGLGVMALLSGCEVENSDDEKVQRGSGSKIKPETVETASQDANSQTGGRFQSPLDDLPVPVIRNKKYQVPERGLTPFDIASRFNNFYEFTQVKEEAWRLADQFKTRPWQIQVAGHVKNPRTIDIDEILKKFPLEERIYRFRCVEAWAMTVPWVGFPLSKFIDWCGPTDKANYVRFLTVFRPEEMPGQRTNQSLPWPYYEGLRLDEARNELSLMTVGLYGKVLPNQNGAPIRIIAPWKYGFKSIKSIVLVEFLKTQPRTFWNDLIPHEYDFVANTDPRVPHPRWSQATERLIDSGIRVPTIKYNGYGEYVASLYA